MYCVRKVTNDLYWVGANDHRLALFENCFPIPRGVSYNAYCLLDEKTVLFDTVDWSACRQLLENLAYVLDGRELDYLLVNHLEPDHAACIEEILLRHPKVKLISNEKAFMLMRQFGFHVDGHECIEVKEGDTFSFGKHTVTFVGAPMVHWPEAMVTFDLTDGVLFSADAFGTFGALNGCLFNDEVDFFADYVDEARRYYTNIVGKYGAQVQALLKKVSALEIKTICPLHGPMLTEDLGEYLRLYDLWSQWKPEEPEGILIAHASIHGNTAYASEALKSKLEGKGAQVTMCDLTATDLSYAVTSAFYCGKLVLASSTYDGGLFPPMKEFLEHLQTKGFRNRRIGLMENGSWAPAAARLMRAELEKMKELRLCETEVSLRGALNQTSEAQMDALVAELCAE